MAQNEDTEQAEDAATEDLEQAAQEGAAEARAKELEKQWGDWAPKTRLGRLVKSGEIRTMQKALDAGFPLREPEIVDILLGQVEDDVLDVNMVQRMTDSGRRVNFRVVAVMGNRDGFVGLAQARGQEVGATIRHTIEVAKTKVMAVRRGCGSWECGCGRPHTVPLEVTGKAGSTEVTLKPAPRGIGLAAGQTARPILRLAGIEDCWTFSKGKTRTTINFALATFEALKKASRARLNPKIRERSSVSIQQGPAGAGGHGGGGR